MPPRDARWLREKAAQFRELAKTCDPAMAAKMLELAIDLDAKAAELDAQNKSPR